MEILILLIPMSVVIALVIGVAFWWSADSGQFDDLESPGQRILLDDDQPGSVKQADSADSPRQIDWL